MNSQHLMISLFILIVTGIGEGLSNNQSSFYGTCNRSFSCGNISGFRYPFRRGQDPAYCGYPGFELNCEEESPPTINSMNLTYRVLEIDPTGQILKIVREDLTDLGCPQNLVNTTIDYDLFSYTSNYMNISLLYGCSSSSKMRPGIPCENNGGNPVFLVPGVQSPESCKSSIVMPFPVEFVEPTETGLVLQKGFEVRWKVEAGPCNSCTQSGGDCLYNNETHLTTCACRDAPLLADSCSTTQISSPPGSKGALLSKKWKLVIGISCSSAGTIIMLLVILRMRNQIKRLWENPKVANHQIETFISKYGSLAPKRFKYLEVKKMTKTFLEKLGHGGYGSVYKGELSDGKLVAVKLLSEATGDGEDFINEVASIGRTSHVNIVTLLGFCIEGKKRALVYEFMPNGSLDKFLRGDGSHLDWNTLFQIAKGIARGLEYLHQGCNTRIVHFDIKPHNILLDEEFVPKISDFGLAKLCKRKESIVSVMGARGTAGYMAPEVFFRSLGGASHKSDVYSYGMMVLEMTGAHKNNKVSETSTSEEYFPDWVYKQIESGSNLEDHGVTTEYEEELARKMMTVSLWCIQSDPSDRPSISKVVEMLEGSFESLQVPPRRFWPSPSRPAQDTSPSATQSSSGERLSRV